MARLLQINRENATEEELDTARRCAPNSAAAFRIFAIDFLYRGTSVKDVSNQFKVHEKTVRTWLTSFNNRGIDGLLDKRRSGRPRRIPVERFQGEYLPLVLDPDGEHWSAVKFHGYLTDKCKEQLSYNTVRNYFQENNLSRVKGRPWNEKQDPEKREAFLLAIKEVAQEPSAEIWFGDEVGFEGDPRPRTQWVVKGSKPKVKRADAHLRYNAVGAVNPESGECVALAVPHNDAEVFQLFLNELHKSTKGRAITLVLDNASWHKTEHDWHNITPLYLSPYSPDLNPIENIWRLLKMNFFVKWYAKNIDELLERVCTALSWLFENPEAVKSTASMKYLLR
jgi:transposase